MGACEEEDGKDHSDFSDQLHNGEELSLAEIASHELLNSDLSGHLAHSQSTEGETWFLLTEY